MFTNVSIALFFTLFGMAFVWFALVFWFFRRLRLRHPAAYEAIGSPTLFWNNSMRNNWLFLKFLYTSSWRTLADPGLSFAARLMQVWTVVYILGFAVLLILFLREIP
jgi:hypothetical protein